MDRPSRSERKALVGAWKARERASAQSRFPLADAALAVFFAELEQRLEWACCRHDTAQAEAVARNVGLSQEDVDRLLRWCETNGGLCDCEIVLNSMGYWEENRAAK